jgi:hypothetical protein
MTQSATDMPASISLAAKLLWLSLLISIGTYVWVVVKGGFTVGGVIQFAIPAAVWAFAIILFPTRNNLARLVILALTVYYIVMLLVGISGILSVPGMLALASVAAAALGSFLLIQEPGNAWFGPLTNVSL